MAHEDDRLAIVHLANRLHNRVLRLVARLHRAHHHTQIGISAVHHGRGVEARLLLLKAQLLRHRRDRSIEVFAHNGVGLKVIGLATHDLDKAVMLRANLNAGLVEVNQFLATLKVLAEGTAAMELAVFIEHARNERRVGTRLAQAHIGVLAHRNTGIRHERPATLSLGHIGHQAHRTHQVLVNTTGNPQVNGVRIANIISANQQLLHQQLQSMEKPPQRCLSPSWWFEGYSPKKLKIWSRLTGL